MQGETIVLPLARGWRFCRGDVKRWKRVDHAICYSATKAGREVGDMEVFLNENDWTEVCLPHDWNTGERSDPACSPSNGFKPRGIGWYYDEIELPEYDEEACALLEFEGVMGECVVYVNGVLAARNESGYTGFCFDVSDYLLPGQKNRIVVSVDNARWEGWWYEGAGIYRPVNLYLKPRVHFAHQKTFVRPEREGGTWRVRVVSEIENACPAEARFAVRARVLDPEGRAVAEFEAGGRVAPFGRAACVAEGPLDAQKLWSVESPNLYEVENRLFLDDHCLEVERISFGFRTIQWTDHGMYLNGIQTPVRGICCHQDHAGVGIAVTKSLTRYRIARLKAMGCNAYRCAHHCPSKELLDVCDEMGMLVMAENRHFRSSDEVMRQLDALTLLSRNHPSVFLYSLFNEEPWQAEDRGRRMAARMLRRVRMNDDTRAVTAAMNGGVLTNENASDVLDVAGINYYVDDYMAYARRRPGHPMIGTENGPLYATRDIYRDDPKAQVYNSYGLTCAPFGQTLEKTMEAVGAAPQVAGLFVWGGFDYRGEPQPFEWPSVFSHWGLTDNCGFEKNTFFMLKSYYSDPDQPMLHLLPHWNWGMGETVRVCAMTNCDLARLFLNGRPLQAREVKSNRAEWNVPFEPGVLRVEAVKGDTILSEEIRTAGPPARLEVIDAADERDYDSSIINIRLLDANGIPTPFLEADREVRFEVRRGDLLGVGNGNPNGTQPDVADTLPTFCGRCQAIVRPDAQGRVHLVVHAAGIPDVEYSRG